jgi:predicted esterase
MGELTWDAMQREFWRLNRDGDFAEALDLVTRHERLFPQREPFYNWKMCMAARLGDAPLAIQTLQQAIDDGLWFNRAALRDDEDVAALQGQPEFERLAAICEERYAAAAAKARPVLLKLAPHDDASPPFPLLVALHGNNSNSRASAEHWRTAAEHGWLLALPQSAQLVGVDAYVWNDRERGMAQVSTQVAALSADAWFDSARVVVGGFSMGGGLAIELGLSNIFANRGFVAVGPYLPDVATLRPLIESGQARGRRGYIIVGDQDESYYQASQEVAALLKEHAIPCELEVHAGLGHVFPPEFPQSLARALSFVLGE